MKSILRRLLGTLTIGLCAGPSAHGQQIPPIQQGQAIVRTTLENNRVSMVDVENEYPIILPVARAFQNFAPSVVGEMRLQEQPDGCDVIYTFRNTGATPARMGRLDIGTINLGNNIQYRDFRHIGEPVSANYNNYSFQAFRYPSQIYSPIWTLYNNTYAVSISLQYPILDYRHDVSVMLGSTPANAPAQYGPRGWFVEYRFANIGGETPQSIMEHQGEIPPGETRTYVMSVRVTKNLNEWIRTLTPYRDYFRSMYGSVRYERDARPIWPQNMAVLHLISEQNPYGFENFGNKRPDLYGFRPWADHLKRNRSKWSRVMLWAPTGLYNQNQNMNFPFEFTSKWLTEPRMANVFDDEVGLPSVAESGMSVGLWWGRTLQVSRGWNSGQFEIFDPDNPAHVARAFEEMDLAVRAGATEIGLDTFTPGLTPIWKLVPWMERMQEAYPQVKFCIEPVTNDIMHRLGSTYVVGWNLGENIQRPEDIYDIHNPFYLADLLVPGHESWGAFSYHRHRPRSYPVTPDIVQADAERLASFGFVPLMYDDVPNPENLRAAESWLTTLPADMLRGMRQNRTYGHAVRRPDGRLVIVSDEGGPPPRLNAPGPGSEPAPGGPTPIVDDNGPDDTIDDSGEPEPDQEITPIERTKRRINGSIKIQGGPDTGAKQDHPSRASEGDLPGSRTGVTVPGTSSSKKGKGKGSNPAWLQVLAKKGYMKQGDIDKAVKGMPPSGPATVVPGKK